MKFGITNKGFRRLAFLSKEAIEYTDDWGESWEEEYGEDWSEPEYAQPDPDDIGGWEISPEDFAKGELVLAGMGMDVENMSEQDIANILANRPEYLELVPQFNVEGQWVHTLRDKHLPSLQGVIEDIMSSSKEMCVTAGDAAEFWNFSAPRYFAIVMEGVCKVLWNADMYSVFSSQENQLVKRPGTQLDYIDRMTEGWIVPAECTLVGLKVNWDTIFEDYGFTDSTSVKTKIEEIANSLGVPLITTEELEKNLVSLTILEAEEAQDYAACDVDLGSPEHLYEAPEDAAYDSYEEMYGEELEDAVMQEDLEKINELLAQGVAPPKEAWRNINFIQGLLDESMPQENLLQLVNYALNTDLSMLTSLFTEAVWAGKLDIVELLLDEGYIPDLSTDLASITEFVRANRGSVELIDKILESYTNTLVPSAVLFRTDPNDTELMQTLIYSLGARPYYHMLYSAYTAKKYDLLRAIAEVAGPDMINESLDKTENDPSYNDLHRTRIEELRDFFGTGGSSL
jgi:hypothetical protein